MKKILMFAFAVFFVVGMFYFFNMGHSFTYWKGAIKAPGQEQEMILVLEKNLFGDVQGKMTFPGQMLNLKTNRCYFSGDSLKIEVSDMMQAKFSGARVGTGITGNWIQNGRSFPVILMETNSVPLQQFQVNKIVNYAKENALNRSSVNWDSLEMLHYFMVHHDKPDSGLIIGANRLLKVLQDNHGFLIYKGDAVRNPVAYKGKPVKGIKAYTNFFYAKSMAPQMLKNNIAYIRIPTVWALTKEEIHKKVLEIQNAICGLHYTSETNWIIDFRLNNGGQFRSMLAAIGNLIGNGTSLYFVSNDGKAGEQWILRRDGLYSDSTLATSRSQSCDVINYHPKIAILIGSGTSSAAEDVVAAFKGRKNTRFFGEETKGLVTVNSTITLDENTFFSLITGNIKDRNGKIYTDSIKPDVVINEEDDFGDIESDPKVLAASKWLQSGLFE